MGKSERRILSLDGGGVRGVFEIAFLERIEAVLQEARGTDAPVRLAEAFDLIGGTSTGAVIGTALALGLSASEIRDFYFRLAPRVFRRSRWRIAGLQTRFDSRALEHELVQVLGDRALDSPDLRTGLAIVLKRMDTGSAWIVTNNEKAKYWNESEERHRVGNRHYRLTKLVRASTAAPYFFAPEEIPVFENQPGGLFIDGGVTPYNNPALALFQVVTIPAYGFAWQTGADRLQITSIGTGRHRVRLSVVDAGKMTPAGFALKALLSVGADCGSQVLAIMQVLGRSHIPWTINREVGDLSGVLLPQEPLFSFCRYDVELNTNWLHKELGFRLPENRIEELKRMDEPGNIPVMYEIGQAAAQKFVRAEHFAL
jgi:hypothetical protein